MSDPKERIWDKAYNAYLSAGLCPDEAVKQADHALKLYEERWPADRSVIATEEHLRVLKEHMSIARDEVIGWATGSAQGRNFDGRQDAEAVLDSFVRAMDACFTDGVRAPWYPPPAIASPGVDLQMLQRALSQLEVDGRWDALNVLKDLVHCLQEAQKRGERLRAWVPPSRG